MFSRIYGFHAVEQALKRGGIRGSLYLSHRNRRTENLAETAGESGIAVIYDPEIGSHDAVLVVASASKPQSSLRGFLSSDISADSLVLLLDGITDPQNLGAILRSADEFRVDLVVALSRRTAGRSEAVDRTSSGASLWVPIVREPNLTRAMQNLKSAGYWVFGADMEGTPADQMSLKGRIALVMGSEGQGLSRLVKERCDGLVGIPTLGHVESLNVSVAAGILLYEVRRQQKQESSGSYG